MQINIKQMILEGYSYDEITEAVHSNHPEYPSADRRYHLNCGSGNDTHCGFAEIYAAPLAAW